MIKKVIERFLGQIGVNIEEWYQNYKRPANIGYNIYFYKTMNNSKKIIESNKKINLELKNNHFDSLDKRKQDIEDKKSFFVGSKISLRDDTKRSDILNFFQPLESKKNDEILVQSKSKDNKDNNEEKEIIDLKYYEVDENEELIEIEKKDESKKIKLIKHRENQMKYLENIKKLKILQKKKLN